tara:strand:+ start:288 stop:653 length:366 start_codon:yes stop_codon:yes gene_type:complete
VKVKLTILVVACDKYAGMGYSPELFLTDDGELPSSYISTKSVEEEIAKLSGKYFLTDYRWMNYGIIDFRRISNTESEVVYGSFLPKILNTIKSGSFVPHTHTKEMDSYYVRLLSRRPASIL